MDFEQINVCWVHVTHVSIYLITKAASRAVFCKKKGTLAQVLSCEFWEISKNTFSYRMPLAAASVILFQWKTQVLSNIRPSRLFKFSTTYAAWKVSNIRCVKRVQIRSYFWFVFSSIQAECRKIWTRNNSVFEHFSRSDKELNLLFMGYQVALQD